MKFKSVAAARTYVYGVIASMLLNEFNEPDFHEGWFGGVEDKTDRARLIKALRAIIAEMERTAGRRRAREQQRKAHRARLKRAHGAYARRGLDELQKVIRADLDYEVSRRRRKGST